MTDRLAVQFIHPGSVADGYYIAKVVSGAVVSLQVCSPILLIEHGASVPPGTPAGTIIAEKA